MDFRFPPNLSSTDAFQFSFLAGAAAFAAAPLILRSPCTLDDRAGSRQSRDRRTVLVRPSGTIGGNGAKVLSSAQPISKLVFYDTDLAGLAVGTYSLAGVASTISGDRQAKSGLPVRTKSLLCPEARFRTEVSGCSWTA
jgi:hypothetical protein